MTCEKIGVDQPLAAVWTACAAALLLAVIALPAQAQHYQVHLNQQVTIDMPFDVSQARAIAEKVPNADYSWLKDLRFGDTNASFTPTKLGTHTLKYTLVVLPLAEAEEASADSEGVQAEDYPYPVPYPVPGPGPDPDLDGEVQVEVVE